MKKRTTIIIILIVIIAASVVSFLLWRSHINSLRSDMENYISASFNSLQQGEANSAMQAAVHAGNLAMRIGNLEALDIADTQVALSLQIIGGDGAFIRGQYTDARDAYLSALDYAYNLDIDLSFISDLIATMDKYIRFYALIEHADNLVINEHFKSAIIVYEEALSIAVTLSFEDGKARATAGIEHAEELIIIARRAQAASYTTQGTLSFLSSNYTEAIEFFQSALEIYRELGDTGQVNSVYLQINSAQRQIEEQRRREAEEEERLRREAEEYERRRLEAEEDERRRQQETQVAPLVYLDSEPEEVILNYAHNRNIDFDLQTLIDNQALPPANQVRMGNRPGLNEGWYNGCGWIAAYNALIILGTPIHPAEIVNHIEEGGGTVLDGMFGTFPHAIERLFVEMGYDVNHNLFPQRLNLDNAIRNSRVSILAYTHTRAAHFIAIEYRPEDGTFVVYNDGFARRRAASLGLSNNPYPGAVIDSVNSLIRETPDMLFSFSLITIS